MITPILQLLASVVGLVAAWAFTKFILVPLFQKYQNWADEQANKKAIADSAKINDKINQEQRDNASREESDFERLEREAAEKEKQNGK